METTFYIKNDRIGKLRRFIRSNLKTVRFLTNPYIINGEYCIHIEMSVEDGNKLSKLRNRWHEEDIPPQPKRALWKTILDVLFFA